MPDLNFLTNAGGAKYNLAESGKSRPLEPDAGNTDVGKPKP